MVRCRPVPESGRSRLRCRQTSKSRHAGSSRPAVGSGEAVGNQNPRRGAAKAAAQGVAGGRHKQMRSCDPSPANEPAPLSSLYSGAALCPTADRKSVINGNAETDQKHSNSPRHMFAITTHNSHTGSRTSGEKEVQAPTCWEQQFRAARPGRGAG